MENITLGQIVAGIAVITAIVGFFKLIGSFIKSHYTDVINNIKERLTIVENKVEKHDTDMLDSKEERLLLMGGVLACLKGLQEQGCNHSVTTTITKLEDYMAKKAHE